MVTIVTTSQAPVAIDFDEYPTWLAEQDVNADAHRNHYEVVCKALIDAFRDRLSGRKRKRLCVT
jgi:hypothetical protein